MRRAALSIALVAGLLALPHRAGTATGRGAALAGLASFFDIDAGLVRDTNGDGLADAVAARIILPVDPALEEVQASVNLAARLGFETTALDLPLVLRDHEIGAPAAVAVPVLVGSRNRFVQALATRGALDLPPLEAGQGLIALARSPLGGGDGLVVVGADPAGTLAAADVLAARLPRLWSPTGATLRMVEEQATRWLRRAGVSTDGVAVSALVVDRDRRGLASVVVRARVGAGDLDRARRVVEQLDLAHRRGLEPRTLSYAAVAATTIEFWVGDRPAARATVRRAGLPPRILTPPIDPDELAPDSPGERGARPIQTAAPAKAFDLASAYSVEGWFGDVYTDLVPDRLETTLVVGSDPREALAAAHVAARLGLESTGVTLPVAKIAASVRDPSREANPILIGRENALVRQLEKIGKVGFDDLEPGDGVIQVVPRAFGATTATVVAGADASGTEAAGFYLARRAPYLWETARGAYAFEDVAEELRRTLQARTAGAQAALALRELDGIVSTLRDKPVASVQATLHLERPDPGLEKFFVDYLQGRLPGAQTRVFVRGVTDPAVVFEETLAIPWEVDDFLNRLRTAVLLRITPGAAVEVEARLSESPEVRRRLADQVRAELLRAGAANPRVRIRSAYKQGFLWLVEEVIPALKGRPVRAVRIKVAEHRPDLTEKFKFYMLPSRWLHELYPVDEVFARELGIPAEAVTLELVDGARDVYVVEALDASGRLLERAAFSPKAVEREYLEKFPGWSRVEVTTGWITATIDGQTVVDARIPTDPERFWDHYQGKVLPRIYDHVMKLTGGRPLPDRQPFHRDLEVEVRMSEPDFRIGIDEELVSSLEALHEDLYFVTLDFFDALGRTTTRRRLAAPGKILPIVHPDRPGRPGEARIRYVGHAAPGPVLEVAYTEKGAAEPTRVRRELTRIEAGHPAVARVVVRADRVRALELVVEPKDDRETARAVDLLDGLARLRAAGLYAATLSYEGVDRVVVTLVSKDSRTRRVLPRTGAAAPSRVRRAGAKPSHPLVPSNRVIGPDESEAIVAALSAYPEVRSYVAGRSYLGREISVMELTLPAGGQLVSTTKLTAWKPTILITGRQHANEVSSTSHILRLAELVVTDPAYRDLLRRVNIILHPVENPDGAAIAFELQKLTPTHMLHAGRYSALGMDVASQVGEADPLLPEALVRGKLWSAWLPDIYLNPHGYPSHEWVQPFAGYVPPGFRSYWSTRGWYTSVGGLRDPRYPQHAQVIDAIRESIVREINRHPQVRAMNLRHQARYRKWAFGFAPHVFNQEIYRDTAIYYSDPESGQPSGSRQAGAGRFAGRGGRSARSRWPQVTYFIGGTEAPDETAQGEWLALVTQAGFSYLMASINYLKDGRYAIERIEEEADRDRVSLTRLRVRPVLPPRGLDAVTTNGTAGRP
jgi:hypothetical protein